MSSFAAHTAPEIVIRLQLWQRIAVGLFGLVWFGGLSIGLYITLRNSSPPIPIIFMLFGALVFRSIFRLRLTTRGDHVEVRNAYKTFTLHRSEISEIRTGRGTGGPGARMIVIVPHVGDLVSVDVSGRFLPRQGGRLDEHVTALQAWHARS